LRTYNKLIVALVIAFGIINPVLAAFGQKDLAIYFILDAIAFLIITLLFVYLNPRGRTALNAMSAVIFAGFMVIVVIKVLEILK